VDGVGLRGDDPVHEIPDLTQKAGAVLTPPAQLYRTYFPYPKPHGGDISSGGSGAYLCYERN